jgi:hypothetical protein
MLDAPVLSKVEGRARTGLNSRSQVVRNEPLRKVIPGKAFKSWGRAIKTCLRPGWLGWKVLDTQVAIQASQHAASGT